MFEGRLTCIADFDAGHGRVRERGKSLPIKVIRRFIREQPAPGLAGLEALKQDPKGGRFIFPRCITVGHRPHSFVVVMAPAADGQLVVAGAFYYRPLVEHILANVFTPTWKRPFLVHFVGWQMSCTAKD